MDGNVVFMIREGITGKVLETTASGTDTANIFITAGSIAEAMDLLPEAETAAVEAMANWRPEEQAEEKTQEHYRVEGYSNEKMDEAVKKYEESPAGKQFVKSIERAREFVFKHKKGSFLYSQIDYLVNKHHNSFIEGCFDIFALSYRRGYMQGKKAAKKK